MYYNIYIVCLLITLQYYVLYNIYINYIFESVVEN